MWVYWPISKQINNTILQFSKIDYYKPSNWNADIQLTSISKFNPNIYIDERQNIRNFFNPNSKSNSFSKQFNKKSHNLVVNFFILTIDTPTYLSNQTNLPRLPNKIFFFQTYLSRSRLHTYGADRPKTHLPGQCMVTFFIPFTTTDACICLIPTVHNFSTYMQVYTVFQICPYS